MTNNYGTAALAAIAVVVLVPVIHYATDFSNVASSLFASQSWGLSAPIPQKRASGVKVAKGDELLYTIANTEYFSPLQQPVASFPFIYSGRYTPRPGYFPVTVIRVPTDQTTVNPDTLHTQIDQMLADDDVLKTEFLETVVLLPALGNPADTATMTLLGRETFKMLSSKFRVKQVYVDPTFYLPRKIQLYDLGIDVHRLMPALTISGSLHGPYLASFRPSEAVLDLYPAYRLYSDTYRAFLYGMYPLPGTSRDEDTTYRAFCHVDHLGYNLIPVPSRLYAIDRSNGVAGERIAVKDVYDVKGVPTNGGSRAYGELYGAVNSTASTLKRLEKLGGHLIGKTKTAAFVKGSDGNGDTVDEQYPFSARGDGWLTIWGSSSGSAAAMTAYDWLDAAVCIDTHGSIRNPAAIGGLYANRPTTGILDMDGVMPLHEYADTPGILSRDPTKFTAFLRPWFEESPLKLGRYRSLPKSIIAPPDYLKQATPEAQAVVDDFVQVLKDKLGLQIDSGSLDEKMSQAGFDRGPLKHMSVQYQEAAGWWVWEHVGKRFYGDYARQNGGRLPGIDPTPQGLFEAADKDMNWEQYHEKLQPVKDFKAWFGHTVLPHSNTTGSQSIMLLGLGTSGAPQYREDELNKGAFEPDTSLPGAHLSPFTGSVDYTIPIGQVEYTSAISKIKEKYPVSINLVAHSGSDYMLFDFVDRLAEAGLIHGVKTGRSAF